MQGHGDFSLSDIGRQQAEKLARSLLSEGWLPSHVYSSPLKRAVETTQILLDGMQIAPLPAAIGDLIDAAAPPVDGVPDAAAEITVEYADELKEFQNGIFQGLTWAEAMSRYPDLCHALESSPDWIPIPEAESLQDARTRSLQFVHRLLEQHRNGDQVWIITHSWIMQHLIAELMGSDRSWRLRATNTALFEFWIDQSRWHVANQNRFNTDLWQVRRFNDAHHLQV